MRYEQPVRVWTVVFVLGCAATCVALGFLLMYALGLGVG